MGIKKLKSVGQSIKPLATKAAYATALLNPITAIPAAVYGVNYLGRKKEEANTASLLTVDAQDTPEQTEEKARMETLKKKREGELRGETSYGRASTMLTQQKKSKTLLG